MNNKSDNKSVSKVQLNNKSSNEPINKVQSNNKKEDLLDKLRQGETLAMSKLIKLIFALSLPAIMAQISTIIMEYIDASMVGHLGANSSAAIGLVASTTWLFGGVSMSIGTGFTVQVAQLIGAGNDKKARDTVKTGLILCLGFSLVMMSIGLIIHSHLPVWLGGDAEIIHNAAMYFMIYAAALPISEINYAASGMLQGSGNMKVPGLLHVLMCVLDVLFNMLLIFETRSVEIGKWQIIVPGLGLGVVGAALGTALAELVIALLMLYFLMRKSEKLHWRKGEKWVWASDIVSKGIKIAVPIALENVVTCGAQIAGTTIVAPLGTIAVAANSLSVTAESLCYMPGYGISHAATTLIGQSVGAKRDDLTGKLSWLITGLGMGVMAGMAVLMYIFAPQMIGILSPDPEVQALGTAVLRIEAFAEPFYAASIVATGVFRGAGDTLVPSTMNFCSMWLVRIPISYFLAPRFGLRGVWLAMCIELCVRGILFLLRMVRFSKKNKKDKKIRRKY